VASWNGEVDVGRSARHAGEHGRGHDRGEPERQHAAPVVIAPTHELAEHQQTSGGPGTAAVRCSPTLGRGREDGVNAPWGHCESRGPLRVAVPAVTVRRMRDRTPDHAPPPDTGWETAAITSVVKALLGAHVGPVRPFAAGVDHRAYAVGDELVVRVPQ